MVQEAIAERLPMALLEQRHLELLNKRELVLIGGIQVDNGPDVQAVSKALDMAYKIRGAYAPEKSLNLTVNATTPELLDKSKAFDDWYRAQQLQGDRAPEHPRLDSGERPQD